MQQPLDTKEPKSQDGKNLLPARPAPGPVFRRAFARFFFIVILTTTPRCFLLPRQPYFGVRVEAPDQMDLGCRLRRAVQRV